MGDEYTFVQLADTQFGMVSEERNILQPDGSFAPGKLIQGDLLEMTEEEIYAKEYLFSEMVVKAMNNMVPKPKFVIVCGDLVNASPLRSLEINAKQVSDFKNVFSKLDSSIKLVCVCGNHDVGDAPTDESLKVYRGNFGKDYFTFTISNDQYLVMNSQYYKGPENVRKEVEIHEKWMKDEMESKNDFRYRMMFSHISPFIYSPDEPDAYFNFASEIRKKILAQAESTGFSHWFCGHYHRNAGGRYKNLEVVTTCAVGGNVISDENENVLEIAGVKALELTKRRSGMRIVSVGSCGVTHEFKTLEQLESENLTNADCN